MTSLLKTTEIQGLYKELGELDRKRKVILQKIRSNPEIVIAEIQRIVKSNSEKWFVRTERHGSIMPLTDTDKVLRICGVEIKKTQVNFGNSRTLKLKKMNENLYDLTLSIEYLNGVSYTVNQQVTSNNPLSAQIYQSMVELTPLQLKLIKKQIEELEKKSLKNKEILRLQEIIANATEALKLLKK